MEFIYVSWIRIGDTLRIRMYVRICLDMRKEIEMQNDNYDYDFKYTYIKMMITKCNQMISTELPLHAEYSRLL